MEKSTPKGVWIFWLCVVTILGVWFLGDRFFSREYSYLQTVILAFTFIAVVIYTIDNRRMQQAMVKQTNLSILPVFVIHVGIKRREIEGTGRHYDVLELENIGNGVALNIHIDTIRIAWAKPEIEGVWTNARIVFNPMMSIKPSERVVVDHQSIYGEKDEPLDRRFDLMDKLSTRADYDYELKIRFSDVLGSQYVQTIHAGISGAWPGSVEGDLDGVTARASFSNNPFRHSPLRHLRPRRPPATRR